MKQNFKRTTRAATDSFDHLAVLEARARNAGKRTYSSAEVRTRPGLTSKK